jgi:hypothetical protein
MNWTKSEGPDRGVIKWDVIFHYSYLPAAFIHHDLTLKFAEEDGFVNDNKFWYYTTESGSNVNIKTMGMSYLYAPFFFTAHLLAPAFGQERDGFQSIYQFFLVFGGLVYLGLGLLFLRKVLLQFFTPLVTAITIALIGLGTNLYNYGTYEAALTHLYAFVLVSLLLYIIIEWYRDPAWGKSLMLGVLFGLLVMIRYTNLFLIVPVLLWGIHNRESLRERAGFLLDSWSMILMVLAGFLLPWIPQLIYWKEFTGELIYMGHRALEGQYYPGNPHILDFLFSYRKGWFVYTPLMFIAITGFIPLYREWRGIFFPVLVFILIMIYVNSSWWSWWHGGGFGMSPMVDYYGLLALPMAAIISYLMKRPAFLKAPAFTVMTFFLFLNIFQTFQYKKVLIHWNGMTKKSYWTIFLRANDRYGYWQNLDNPDEQLARQGIYVYYPLIGIDERLEQMPEEDGKIWLTDEIRRNRRLIRDIRRYCQRTGSSRQEALDMVLNRVYQHRTGMED